MYCQNCNQQIPDGSIFCTNCGAPQQPQQPVNPAYQQPVNPAYQQPVYQQPQQPVNPAYQQPVNPAYQQPVYQQPAPAPAKKKSKLGIIAIIGFVVVLLIIIVGVAGNKDDSTPSDTGNNNIVDEYGTVNSDTNKIELPVVETTTQETINPEFEKFFTDLGIDVPEREDFGSNYKYAAFAYMDEYNEVFIHEYAYTGDEVCHRLETVIYPVGGFTQEEKDNFIKQMDETYSKYDDISCMEITHTTMGEDFIVYKIRYTDMSSYASIRELQNAGIVQSGIVTTISFDMTKTSLLSQGYVARNNY